MESPQPNQLGRARNLVLGLCLYWTQPIRGIQLPQSHRAKLDSLENVGLHPLTRPSFEELGDGLTSRTYRPYHRTFRIGNWLGKKLGSELHLLL